MASQKGRKLVNWNSPIGWTMKGAVAQWKKMGLSGASILTRYKDNWPDYKKTLGDVTDNAILQRADKALRYSNEWPETHPVGKLYWQDACDIVNGISEYVEKPVPLEIDVDYIYVGQNGNPNWSCIGITCNADARERDYCKSGVTFVAVWVIQGGVRDIENQVKRAFSDLVIGNTKEAFHISPTALIEATQELIIRSRKFNKRVR